MKKILILLFLIISDLLIAQNNFPDYNLYMNSSKENALLYRGAMAYKNRKANDGSTYYAYSLDFEKGIIKFREKVYSDISLNIDAEADELIILDSTGTDIILNKDFVSFFSIGVHRFINIKSNEFSNLGEGYYEVIYEKQSVLLYKKNKKKYYEDKSGKYLKRGFELLESYHLFKAGIWYDINSWSDLRKIYKEQRRTINNIISGKDLDIKKNKEYALIMVLSQLEKGE